MRRSQNLPEELACRPSFVQVFAIGEEVKETNDSGFLGTVPTLHTQLLADNSLLQVSERRPPLAPPLAPLRTHALGSVVMCGR